MKYLKYTRDRFLYLISVPDAPHQLFTLLRRQLFRDLPREASREMFPVLPLEGKFLLDRVNDVANFAKDFEALQVLRLDLRG